MKRIILLSVGWMAVSSVWAGPDRARARVDAPAALPPAAVMPIATDMGEPRGGVRLRDALRQPFDAGAVPGQPYRLSEEERQRLREQVRGHQINDRRFQP